MTRIFFQLYLEVLCEAPQITVSLSMVSLEHLETYFHQGSPNYGSGSNACDNPLITELTVSQGNLPPICPKILNGHPLLLLPPQQALSLAFEADMDWCHEFGGSSGTKIGGSLEVQYAPLAPWIIFPVCLQFGDSCCSLKDTIVSPANLLLQLFSWQC